MAIKKTKNGKFDVAKGVLWGGVAGTLATLFFAPKSGKELRKDIRKKSNELRDGVETKMDHAQKNTEKFIKNTNKKLEHAVTDFQKSTAEIIDDGRDTVRKEKKRFLQATEAGVDAFRKEIRNGK